MSILIDPPVWPAHGTVWSHLVSDHSLEELHHFAARLGIPRRGFDLDHYDVQLRQYDRAVRYGARPVSPKTVVQSLQAAGLRVRQKERPTAEPRARREYLQSEWLSFGQLLQISQTNELWITTGQDLLTRWNEPHRSYHNELHLEDVLLAFNQFTLLGTSVDPLTHAAAWFHDAVYTGSAGEDELASAQLAYRTLGEFHLPQGLHTAIAACIVATTPPAQAKTSPEFALADHSQILSAVAVLCDADLSIFAASEQRYRQYATAVREEYAHVTDHDFAHGRAEILSNYLAQPRLFHTDTAYDLWEARARFNVAAEVALLREQHNPNTLHIATD